MAPKLRGDKGGWVVHASAVGSARHLASSAAAVIDALISAVAALGAGISDTGVAYLGRDAQAYRGRPAIARLLLAGL